MKKEEFSKIIRDYTNNLVFGKTDTVFSDMLKFTDTLWENYSECSARPTIMPEDGLPEWWPENPYPESIFPMTNKEYLEAVPNPNLRTAISGFLYRAGWLVATKQISEALRNYLEDGNHKNK